QVGTLQQLVQGDQLDTELGGASRGDVGVVGDDLGLERGQTRGEQLADAAEADDADGLAVDLHAVELAALPGVLTQGGVGGRDLAGRGQQQGDRVLGGGVDVGGRRVHDHHAALGGRG